jgi:hypothetical protein
MKPVWWMAGLSVCSCFGAIALLGRGPELFLGMSGPLVVAVFTWVLVERTYRWNPGGLTALMMMAFGAKMVLFGTYVVIALRVLSVRPIPFVLSFTTYFIALHLAEALSLRRLFTEDAHLTPHSQLTRQ